MAGGLLSGKFSRENQKPEGSRRSEMDFPIVEKERVWRILDAIEPMIQKYNASAARISLAWLLSKPVTTSVIIGAKRVDQLRDNIAAVELQLSNEDIAILDKVSTLPVEYPDWIIEFQDKEGLEDLKERNINHGPSWFTSESRNA